MPEVGRTKSKYALKREGKLAPQSNTRSRRACDNCKLALSGRKGHGFVAGNGRQIVCGFCRKEPRFRA